MYYLLYIYLKEHRWCSIPAFQIQVAVDAAKRLKKGDAGGKERPALTKRKGEPTSERRADRREAWRREGGGATGERQEDGREEVRWARGGAMGGRVGRQ